MVRGARPALRAAFPSLVDLQPVAWTDEGLLCAPRAAPDQAGPALARCPFPITTTGRAPVIPDPAARLAGGWYVRSPDHAPAPAGLPELVEAAGEGFGPLAHPTTAACLSLIPLLPPGPALDAGCGSGLLTQAWRALGRGPVHALDADPHAVAHARRSLVAAGRTEGVMLTKGMLETLAPDALAGRIVLANLPPPGHKALLGRLEAPPRALLLAGVRASEAGALARRYAALGLRPIAVRRVGAWEARALVRRAPSTSGRRE